jgi:hypothetical protein
LNMPVIVMPRLALVSMAGGCAGGAACLSRVPFLAGRLLAAPAWLDGARAGVAPIPAGPGGCQTGWRREVRL